MRKISSVVLAAVLIAVAVANPAFTEPRRTLKLATTTSTENSGLLDYLLPEFEKIHGVKVHVIAVGTGKALKLGENGDVDVLMVHAPEAETAFVDAGHGVNRRPFMKNDFVIAGPPSDPAGVKKSSDLASALRAVKQSGTAVFISRADDSGTHKKEMELWPLVDGPPPAGRYLEIGQGMEAALTMASEKEAYTLTDRGTFLALKDNLKLVVVFEGDERLDNPYSMIAVNPARWKHVNYMDAMLLIAWLTSPQGQQKIGDFRVNGEVLFQPTAVPTAK